MKTRLLMTLALALAIASHPARACTTFCFEDALVFGKNYDWGVEGGLVLVNKRGVSKQAFVEGNPLAWTSRHGSVTFNQYGREFPCGGINEKGLVIELMWLDDTVYPAPDERPAVPTLQWIQYQLDNAATVDDVVNSDRGVRISGESARIHFLVADARGHTAAVEFLGGEMVVHRGADMPYRALTNDTYAKSAAYARAFDEVTREISRSSLDRFAVAAKTVQQGPDGGVSPVEAAFGLLARVAQGEFTQWSIVYDIAARRVHFRTRVQPVVRWIDLDRLDFACTTPVRMIDIHTPFTGDVTPRLANYAVDANRALVGDSFAKTEFLRDIPSEMLDRLARFPDGMRCAP